MELQSLQNSSRPYKRRKRVGRGIGSGLGKTCGRGVKGAGSRSGYKNRDRYEGGQIPLYRKLPERGFSNARFQKKLDVVNLGQIETMFNDGDVVNVDTLRAVGFLSSCSYGIKLLGEGELSKKVTIQVHAISAQAADKLEKAGIAFEILA